MFFNLPFIYIYRSNKLLLFSFKHLLLSTLVSFTFKFMHYCYIFCQDCFIILNIVVHFSCSFIYHFLEVSMCDFLSHQTYFCQLCFFYIHVFVLDCFHALSIFLILHSSFHHFLKLSICTSEIVYVVLNQMFSY